MNGGSEIHDIALWTCLSCDHVGSHQVIKSTFPLENLSGRGASRREGMLCVHEKQSKTICNDNIILSSQGKGGREVYSFVLGVRTSGRTLAPVSCRSYLTTALVALWTGWGMGRWDDGRVCTLFLHVGVIAFTKGAQRYSSRHFSPTHASC